MRRRLINERIAWCSPTSPTDASSSASTPGAGSTTSVRSVRIARNSLRYCTNSAWQRRQVSMWARSAGPSPLVPSTASGNESEICSQITAAHRSVRQQLVSQLMPGAVQAHL